jgi:hypothetical protein
MPVDARAEYQQRFAARQQRAAELARAERRIGTWRLVLFVLAGVAGWLAFGAAVLDPLWIALPVAGFVVLVVYHGGVIAARQRADRAVCHYARGLARVEDRWAGSGEPGTRFADPGHPYSSDLDVFGRGSLFELLCTARTRAGEDTLASWLLAPAPAAEVGARQAALDELRSCFDLREHLAVLADEVGATLHAELLAAWAAAPVRVRTALRIAAAGAVLFTLVTLASWRLGVVGPWLFAAALALQGALGLSLRRRVNATIRAVEAPAHDLGLLAGLLGRIEREPVRAPKLVALRAALDSAGVAPSRRIAQLERLVNLLDARRNQLFAPVAPLLLWGTQCALAIDAWRAVSGPAVMRWLAAVGEFEALCALSSYAAEHPDDPFAELADTGPLFDGEGLGHPLLPDARCVRNDVRLASDCAVLVVSGSNMSGKSTLLRTVGVNAVLAQTGAPVRARRLRLSALTVGTSMRIQDSLQDGTSRFYAEIQRLRRLLDLASAGAASNAGRGGAPLLFLLDEVLHGTNSHDRRLGAEAVVRSLIARGAIGLITTHDLSLADIADALAPRAANVHFEDHLENGTMVFDYHMRPGVVRKSNALELMRAVGLEV